MNPLQHPSAVADPLPVASGSGSHHYLSQSSSSRPLKRLADSSQSELERYHPAKRARGDMSSDAVDAMQGEYTHVEEKPVDVQTGDGAILSSGKAPEPTAAEPDVPSRKALQYQETMEEELLCGCCTGLLYHPVVISPCGHYFCGSCVVLWVRNGGTSCPACRQPSSSVVPSRLLEAFVDVMLRTYPEKGRPQGEREQADEVYSPSMNISIPPPKPAQPEGLVPQTRGHDPPPDNLARPCPHCVAGNEFGWRCPRPLVDPQTDPEHAWNLDEGTPPGHTWCGTCDELLAVGAPTTTRCSICKTSYCGISVPHLCTANHIGSAHLPPSISNLTGLIQSLDIYEVFNSNATEVEVLLDWLREDGRGPRGVLFDIINEVQSSSGGFQQLIDDDVFTRQQDNDDSAEPVVVVDAVNAGIPPPVAQPAPEPINPPIDEPPQVIPPSATAVAASDPTSSTNVAGEIPPPAIPSPVILPHVIPPPVANPLNDDSDEVDSQDGTPEPLPPTSGGRQQPRFSRMCRECAHELFLAKVYEWWARERQAIIAKTVLPTTPPAEGEPVPDTISGLPLWMFNKERKDCPDGRHCGNQTTPSHAREFNHVISTSPLPASVPVAVPPPPTSDAAAPPVVPPPSMVVEEDDDDEDQVMEDLPVLERILAQPVGPLASNILPPIVNAPLPDVEMGIRDDVNGRPKDEPASAPHPDADSSMEDVDSAVVDRTLASGAPDSSPASSQPQASTLVRA